MQHNNRKEQIILPFLPFWIEVIFENYILAKLLKECYEC